MWTVDYALELLLIGGLAPEAVWLARELGDWKTAVSIGVACQLSRRGSGFPRCAVRQTRERAGWRPRCLSSLPLTRSADVPASLVPEDCPVRVSVSSHWARALWPVRAELNFPPD